MESLPPPQSAEKCQDPVLIPPDPFRVDQEAISLLFPSIEVGKEALYRLITKNYPPENEKIGEDLRNHRTYVNTESNKRTTNRDELWRIYNRLAIVASDYCHGHELDENILQDVENEIRSVFKGVISDNYIDAAIRQIKGHTRIAAYYKQVSAETMQDVGTYVSSEPAQAYDILKIFADPTRPGQEGTHISDIISSNILHAMDTIRGATLYEVLKTSLSNGDFDQFIARDIISFMDSGFDKSSMYARIGQLVSYSEAIAEADSEEQRAIVHERMIFQLPVWPGEQQLAIVAARAQLLNALIESHKHNTTLVNLNISSSKNISYDALQLRIKDVAVQTSIFMGRFFHGRAERTHNIVARKKIHKKLAEIAATTPDEEAAPMLPEPRRIVKLNSTTGHIEEDDEALNKVKDKYMRKFGQGNQALSNDVSSIIEYLRNIDFTSGNSRGIKKLGTPMKLPDRLETLWELKPLDATGLSTSTPIAKGIRLIFCRLPEDTIGIVTMGDRRDIPAILNGLRKGGLSV